MTFKKFYISDNDGKSNCVIRSLCKILNKEIPSKFVYKTFLAIFNSFFVLCYNQEMEHLNLDNSIKISKP